MVGFALSGVARFIFLTQEGHSSKTYARATRVVGGLWCDEEERLTESVCRASVSEFGYW